MIQTICTKKIIPWRWIAICPSPTGLPVLPGSPRSMDRGEPGSTGGWTVVPPWWTGMMPDGPGWTGGLSGGFWHVKNHRGEPWRTGKRSPTWVNRVEPCWHRRSTGKDREGSWRCRRWPGSTGMEKNELLAPLPTVLGRHDVCNKEYFLTNNQRSAMCCLKKTSAGMQLGYKSVLFILHFHLAVVNREGP